MSHSFSPPIEASFALAGVAERRQPSIPAREYLFPTTKMNVSPERYGIEHRADTGRLENRRLVRGARGLLSHHREKSAHLTAIALDDRSKFRALGDHHADTLDDDVIDLIGPVVGNQPPVDPQRRCIAWADDVGRDDDRISIASA